MKSLTMSKNLLGLFSKVAISVVVLAGIIQTQRSLFLPIASDVPPLPNRGAPKGRTDAASRNNKYISKEMALKSKSRSQRSVQTLSVSNVINYSVDNIQPIISCNMKFSACPLP